MLVEPASLVAQVVRIPKRAEGFEQQNLAACLFACLLVCLSDCLSVCLFALVLHSFYLYARLVSLSSSSGGYSA